MKRDSSDPRSRPSGGRFAPLTPRKTRAVESTRTGNQWRAGSAQQVSMLGSVCSGFSGFALCAVAVLLVVSLSGCGAIDSLGWLELEDPSEAHEALSNFRGSWQDDGGHLAPSPTSQPPRKVQPSLVPAPTPEELPECTQSLPAWFEWSS